jgi:hypothetical protein
MTTDMSFVLGVKTLVNRGWIFTMNVTIKGNLNAKRDIIVYP